MPLKIQNRITDGDDMIIFLKRLNYKSADTTLSK